MIKDILLLMGIMYMHNSYRYFKGETNKKPRKGVYTWTVEIK